MNRPIKIEDKTVPVEKLNCEKSLRSHSRKQVLKFITNFGPYHEYGVTLLSNVRCLQSQDAEERHYVDDGASTVLCLQEMKTAWESDKEKMPESFFAGLNEEDFGEEAWLWDSALVKVFEEGFTLTIHRYEDEKPRRCGRCTWPRFMTNKTTSTGSRVCRTWWRWAGLHWSRQTLRKPAQSSG